MKNFKKSKVLVLIISLALVGSLYTPTSIAISFKELLGIGDSETKAEQEKKQAKKTNEVESEQKKLEKVTATLTPTNFDFKDIQQILSVVNVGQRKSLLSNEDAFRKFVYAEARDISLLTAAKRNKIDQSKKARIIVQRNVNNTLREIYINQIVKEKMPADFPNPSQVKSFYEKNKNNYVIKERVHIWQIFLPVKESAKTKEIELTKKEAEAISNDLIKKKQSFTEAAQKHSKHEASRINGGYMGLIKIEEMLPEVKLAMQSLKVGQISKPFKSKSGIHIIKKGEILPEHTIPLDNAKLNITQTMKKQLARQIRQNIVKQAVETYPLDLNDKKIEEWLLKLRVN